MEIVKYKKKNSNEYIITLSDNTSLSFYDDTILYYNLLAKKNLDEKLLKEVNAFNKKYTAYYKALKSIKAKLRTEKEIEKILKKQNFSISDIKFSITKLKEQGYINDNLYIKSYISDQVTLTSKGPNKIINELKRLGFTEEQILKYLNEYNDSLWQEKINKIIAKKIKSNHKESLIMFKIKTKKDLINLGFNLSLIENSLDNVDFSEEDNLQKEFNKELLKLNKKYKDEELKYRLRNNLYRKGFKIDLINALINNL